MWNAALLALLRLMCAGGSGNRDTGARVQPLLVLLTNHYWINKPVRSSCVYCSWRPAHAWEARKITDEILGWLAPISFRIPRN